MKNKILSKKSKYEGRTFSVLNQIVDFKYFDTIEFEIIDRKEVAIIIPLKTEKNIITLNQYRAAINDYIIEFPAGKREPEEDIKDTAIRELKEETGFSASNIKLIGTFFTAPHFTNEKIYVFVASDLTLGNTNRSKKEIISVKEISLIKLINYQKNNLLIDAKTNVALTMLINFKNEK